MSSEVFICNLALLHIGKPRINALSETRAEAAACREFYPHSRRMTLQLSGWTFAKRRVALAALENDFAERWAYTYARPTDALSILRIIPAQSPRFDVSRPPFEVRESHVYTNASPAICEYVFDQTDPARFSPLFCEAVACQLASYLALNLLRSDRMHDKMVTKATKTLSLAITADAAQDAPTYINGESAGSVDYNEARY